MYYCISMLCITVSPCCVLLYLHVVYYCISMLCITVSCVLRMCFSLLKNKYFKLYLLYIYIYIILNICFSISPKKNCAVNTSLQKVHCSISVFWASAVAAEQCKKLLHFQPDTWQCPCLPNDLSFIKLIDAGTLDFKRVEVFVFYMQSRAIVETQK